MTNIALIVLDTLRYDAFEEHFDWHPGIRFDNAWSTSHWTVPAHASLFTGKYASEVGIYAGAQTFDCKEPLLAEQLSDSGYTTRAFSANPNISSTFQGDRGFDQFERSWRLEGMDEKLFDWDDFIARTRGEGPSRFLKALQECVTSDCKTLASLRHGIQLKLRDTQLGHGAKDDGISSALNLVRETKFEDNEFLFMNLMEAHTPYDPPSEWKTVDVELDGLVATMDEPDYPVEEIQQAYDDSVRYLSHMYEKVFNELKKDFDVIITLSDHGELLGEHDAWEHLYGIYPEVTRVPLTIYAGDDDISRRNESVSLLDVHKTVLEVGNIYSDGKGRDIRNAVGDGEYLVESHGLPERNKKALYGRGFDELEFLDEWLHGIVNARYYGYETYDDFEERGQPIYDNPRERISKLDANLEKRVNSKDENIDEKVMDQLADLGYA
ncbi:sulfatase-like hydrolase/transferase [Haloparvum sp. PAK95]|uniref:sulfatase-like hydrolase/transferase n=1 Tax=Haloparvum sp. PAK95 TaxID=3418962 RepID=UPI003D2F1B16